MISMRGKVSLRKCHKARYHRWNNWFLALMGTDIWTTLCRMGFIAGLAAMFLSCCMMETPVWMIALTGGVGGVLALACASGTGWVEGSEENAKEI